MCATASTEPLRLEPCTGAAGQATEELRLSYEQRVRSRLVVRLASGCEATIVKPRGSIMRGGDRLVGTDGRIVQIMAAEEPLLEACSGDATLLARAAYHLGNRHVAVEVRAGGLRIARDAVLGALLERLGLEPRTIEAAFEPEGGAYGHTHAHAPALPLAPLIHEFRGP
jgi:urease accessory protein